jgi:hypothetical protein
MTLPFIDHTLLNDVPFIGNTPDNLHCLQASYGMIRQFYEPEWHIDWKQWSEDTGFVPDKGSWSLAGLLWFKTHGYNVQHITSFDYGRFADEGAAYLHESLGHAVAEWEMTYSDLPLEQARSRQFITSGMWQHRRPDIADIKLYLERGYLVKCIVNLNELNGLSGFLGHALLVIGYTEDTLILHDPGLPPQPYRSVSHHQFLRAWADPNAKMEKLDAIKKL